MKYIIVFLITVSLSACASVSIPTAGVTSDGIKWSGYFDFSEFVFSGGTVICKGKPTMGLGKVNTHYFTCDNGNSGSVVTTRQSMTGGMAKLTFDDGITGNFMYGT